MNNRTRISFLARAYILALEFKQDSLDWVQLNSDVKPYVEEDNYVVFPSATTDPDGQLAFSIRTDGDTYSIAQKGSKSKYDSEFNQDSLESKVNLNVFKVNIYKKK